MFLASKKKIQQKKGCGSYLDQLMGLIEDSAMPPEEKNYVWFQINQLMDYVYCEFDQMDMAKILIVGLCYLGEQG